MNKKTLTIVIGIAVLVLVAVLFFGGAKNKTTQETLSTQAQTMPAVKDTGVSKLTTPVQTEKDPWTVWSNYLNKAKVHDIAGVKALSYKLSATCADSKQQDACFVKMDNLYQIGSKLKKEDFVNRWEDSKQIILSTNLKETINPNYLEYTKASIIFVKDVDGNMKILALDPSAEWTVPNNTASTTAELQKELDNLAKDSDQDGQTDQFENCIFPQNLIVTDCKKTNPNKRDSLGDGWWDGVRPYLSK